MSTTPTKTTKKSSSKNGTFQTVFANMMLIKNVFTEGQAEVLENFTGIPLTDDCPFVEIIFDPEKKILGVVSKHKKQQFHFLPKLDSNGLPKPNSNKAMAQQMPIAQERLLLETYHEYYIRDPKEISNFIEMYAANANTFDWKSFLK